MFSHADDWKTGASRYFRYGDGNERGDVAELSRTFLHDQRRRTRHGADHQSLDYGSARRATLGREQRSETGHDVLFHRAVLAGRVAQLNTGTLLNKESILGTMNDSRTVFLVDDDPSVRRALTRLMRAAGYSVQPFASAREFLEFGEAGAPVCGEVAIDPPALDGADQLANLGAGREPELQRVGAADRQLGRRPARCPFRDRTVTSAPPTTSSQFPPIPSVIRQIAGQAPICRPPYAGGEDMRTLTTPNREGESPCLSRCGRSRRCRCSWAARRWRARRSCRAWGR